MMFGGLRCPITVSSFIIILGAAGLIGSVTGTTLLGNYLRPALGFLSGSSPSTKSSFRLNTAADNNKPIKDISYSTPGYIHSKQISENGDSLLIGYPPGETYGNHETILHCEKTNGERDYKSEHLIRIFNRTSRSYQVVDGEGRSSVDHSEYFVYVTKEAWSCHPEGDTSKGFMRTVSEMVGFREIFEIKYYDGIEVTNTYNYEGKTSARVREIRYSKPEAPTKALRYDGSLVLQNSDDNKLDYSIAGFKAILHNKPIEEFDNKLFKEVAFDNSGATKTSNVQNAVDGTYWLLIGTKWQKTLGDEKNSSICFQEEGINPLPFEFRPACAVKEEFKRIATRSEEEFIRVSQITKQDLAKFFVPILEEVWNCKTTEGLNFYRIVHEMVGRRPIRRIDSYEGVNNIISIKNNEDKLTVRFREVKYLDPITKEMLRYRGTVRLVQPRIPKPPPTEHGVHYKLNPNRLYRTLISPKGYDLRIGSRWEAKIGNVTDTVECELDENYDYAKSYGTKFRIRVKLVNETFNTITYKTEYVKSFKKSEYYDYVDKEFRICHTRFWKLQFLRVVNIIDILVPVHEIEFYNGVRIFENILTPDKKSVRIEETKFLDPDNLEVVKFEGTVNIKGAPTISGKLTSGIEIIPSDADIFWRVGHFSAEKTTLRELKFNDPPIIPDLKVDEGKPIRFGLTYERDSDYYYADKTVVCERCKSNFNLNDPETRSMVNFVKQGGMAQWVDEKEMSFAQSKKYFKTIRYEEWTCKNPSQDLVFTRLFLEYYYEKKNLNAGDPSIGTIVSTGVTIPVNAHVVFDETQKYIVEFDDIMYFWREKRNGRDGIFRKRYEGELALDETVAAVEKFSGTEKFENENERLTRVLAPIDDIEYHDKFEPVYEIPLQGGLNVEIGTKWQKEFGDSNYVMNCRMTYDFDGGQFDTYMRTRINIGDHIHNQLLFQTYFHELKSEVWNCTDATGRDRRSFLRVVNQFSIKPYQCDVVGKLYHRDGVKVMTGEYTHGTAGCVEIAEVKFIDPRDYSVLKFDGKIQLFKDGIAVPKEITALRLKNVAQIEVSYLPLPDSDKLMKTILKDSGLTIEVGSPHEEILNIHHVNCDQNFGVDYTDKQRYVTRILKNHISTDASGEYIHPKQMSYVEIYECFDIDFELWTCKKEDVSFFRVMTKLKQKPGCSIARIYHYMGVTVNTIGTQTSIKEIKYVNKTTNRVIRYEGFVNVIEVLHKRGAEESWGDASKEIVYELDTPTLYRTEVDSERGVILEVGSRYEGVFGTADDTVLCERDMRHFFNSQYTTKIVSNHKGSTDDSMKVEMDAKTFLEFFVLLRQEVWNCRKNTYQKFLRVVNFLVALKPISKIYHPDGVTIGTQVFPDGTQSKQIKEVKYLNKDSLKVLRYDGGITLETIISKKATRLFQMPSLFEAFKVDTRPPGAISGANVGYWSLDILRVHAMRLIQRSDTIYTDGKAVTYTKNNLQMTKIAEGYNVKMKVGSRPELVVKTQGNEMKCLLDQWNPTNKNQFLTKIVMIFGKDLYQLDVDTITDHFNVKKIEVWVCVNGADTLLRVVTELEGTTGIFVVLHTDGVEVQKIPLGDGEEYTARIIETKYLHPKTFQVEKYAGKVKLIKPEMPKKTEIAIPMWRKALNKMEQVWLNMLRKWAGISDDYIRVLKRGLPEK